MPESENEIKFLDFLPSKFGLEKDENGQVVNSLEPFLQSFEKFFKGLQTEIEMGIPSIPYPDVTNDDTMEFSNYFKYYSGWDDSKLAETMKDRFLMEYLKYIAGWVGLPLREDKSFEWNCTFLRNVISNTNTIRRGTYRGIRALLSEWLSDDEISVDSIKDFIKGSDSLYEYSYTGDYDQYMFSVYLDMSEMDAETSMEDVRKSMKRIKYLLDIEKPAHTGYTIFLLNGGCRVAPNGVSEQDETVKYAQIMPEESTEQYLKLLKICYEGTEL